MNSFGVVVSIAVLISLLEALTFAPMLSAHLFKQQKPKITAVDAETGFAHASLGRIERVYLRSLGWTLRHRFVTFRIHQGAVRAEHHLYDHCQALLVEIQGGEIVGKLFWQHQENLSRRIHRGRVVAYDWWVVFVSWADIHFGQS